MASCHKQKTLSYAERTTFRSKEDENKKVNRKLIALFLNYS